MKLVILDRDGVINQDSEAFVKNADEWIPIEGSIEAIARLSKAGFTVVVATNQSGLGRGLFSLNDLDAMHNKMTQLINNEGGELAGIFYCPHHPDEGCECRKPKAGLIDAIERALETSSINATVIGDSLRDLEAGLIKGCKPILVKTGKGKKTLTTINSDPSIQFDNLAIYNNLSEAVDALIG